MHHDMWICICGCRPSYRCFVVGFGHLTVQGRCCRNFELTLICCFFKFLEPTLNLVSHMQSLLFCAGAIDGVEWCSWHTSISRHTSIAVGPVEWPSTIEEDGLVLVMLICEWWHLWRHLDDICGLCDTCGQLVMIFVDYVILVDNLWWYLSWLWIICDGCVIYVIVVWYVMVVWFMYVWMQ